MNIKGLPADPRLQGPPESGQVTPPSGSGANLRRLGGVVIATTRGEVTIAVGDRQFVARTSGGAGADPVRPGSRVVLEVNAEPTPASPGRLLTAGGRALPSPLPVQPLARPLALPAGDIPLRLLTPGANAATLEHPAAPGMPPGVGMPGTSSARPGPFPPVASPPPPASLPGLIGRLVTAPVGSGEARGQGAAPLPLVDADVVGPSGGGTLLRVGAHLLEAGTRLDLPRGATVRLALAGTSDLTRLLTQSRTAPAPMSAPSPAEAVRAAAEMLARGGTPGLRLPEPGPALATHLLVLIRALDQLAKTSDDSAGGPAAARRGTALDDLAQPGREPLAGGWRLLLLPFGIADDIELLRLYRRPVGNGDDGQDPPHEREAGARTLFDVDFSELGRCQIDALCQERRFDLVVRTAEALPPALRNEIRAAFAAALEASGLAGGIGFQVRAFQEVPKLTSPGRVSIRT